MAANIELIKRRKFCTPLLKLIVLLMVETFVLGCTSSNKTITSQATISEITTNQSSLSKKDVVNYFCSNLTEYFNTHKYYKISSEIYSDAQQQNPHSTSKITKQGNIYNVEYIGSSGKYVVSFSNKEFSGSEQISTFSQNTILGNAIRGKIYDTFFAWIKRVEIALKASNKSHLFLDEIDSAVELENWYNSLN